MRSTTVLPHRVSARLWWIVNLAVLAAAVVLPNTGRALAQEQEPILDASFDVASIKRNISNDENVVWRPQATGEFTVLNVPFTTLLYGAYQLQPYQLIGAPPWVREERYDVVAKLDPRFAARLQPDGYAPTWALALRRLLVERARLTYHRETRQLPVYALVPARRDRKLGPNIRPAQADCDALRTQSAIAARENKPSPYPPSTTTYTPCGLRTAPGRLVSGGFGFAEFMAALSIQTGRPVVDRTGLSGKWDLYLEYAPTPVSGGPAAEPNLPDLFTAIQEQLGLKLEPAQGPVLVFVIDRVERPTND